MAGGKGKIGEYTRSLSPEKRKENAKKAGSTPKRKKAKTIREIARIINEAPAQQQARESLAKLGLSDDDMTNAALIAASVFRAAFEGDMKAVEKWERYVGQSDTQGSATANGILGELVEELRKPYDVNVEAKAIISGAGSGETETD